VLVYELDDRGSRDRFPAGAGNFSASRTALGPTQPPIRWVPGALSLEVKLTTHLHLVPRSKNAWSYTFTPPTRVHGVVLNLKTKAAQGQLYLFTFNLPIHLYETAGFTVCLKRTKEVSKDNAQLTWKSIKLNIL
jgi:hypothetical protein